MTQTASRCLFTEGSITLPEGYLDQTANLFRTANIAAPTYTISRDRLPPGMTLQDYISGQLALMQKHLPNWQTKQRDSARLGKQEIEGERIVTTFQREGRPIAQQQAIFMLNASQILVFTQTKNSALTDEECAQFSALLASFTPTA